MPLISKSEFAKKVGVSPAAITRACKTGRLSVVNGKLLDEKVAMLQWHANRRRRETGAGAPDPVPQATTPAVPDPDPCAPPLEISKRRREFHEANLAELRERQRAGELVALADVHLAYTTLAAEFRAALERIPDKLAPRLAAGGDEHTVHALLQAELDAALMDMARQAETLPARLEARARQAA